MLIIKWFVVIGLALILNACGTGHSRGLLLLNERENSVKYDAGNGVLAFSLVPLEDYTVQFGLRNVESGLVYTFPASIAFGQVNTVSVFGKEVHRSFTADTTLISNQVVMYSFPSGIYTIVAVGLHEENVPRMYARFFSLKTAGTKLVVKAGEITDIGLLQVEYTKNWFGWIKRAKVESIAAHADTVFSSIRDKKISTLPVSRVPVRCESAQ